MPSHRRVLVMDDAPRARELYLRLFNSDLVWGEYRLSDFASGSHELRNVLGNRPDVALLDLRGHSDLEGIIGADFVRKKYPDTRIAIMTATDTLNVSAALQALERDCQFIDKKLVLKERSLRSILDLLVSGADLPLPGPVRRHLIMMAKVESPTITDQVSSRGAESASLEGISPSMRQIAHCFKYYEGTTSAEMAKNIDMEPETFRRTDTRLRTLLRNQGFEISPDEDGRRQIVQILDEEGFNYGPLPKK